MTGIPVLALLFFIRHLSRFPRARSQARARTAVQCQLTFPSLQWRGLVRPVSFEARRYLYSEEPGALAAHAGICAGGEEKSSSLPRPLGSITALAMHHRRIATSLARKEPEWRGALFRLKSKKDHSMLSMLN